jgi:YjbE family integral membrane protein
MWTESAVWAALFNIIVFDILLSGDNAVVIALACRNLPDRYRKRAIVGGTAGAIILRVIFCIMVAWLLEVRYLKLIGGALLIWIGVKLVIQEEEDGGGDGVAAKASLWGAIQTIIVADAVMSLDNAIAIAAAAQAGAGGDPFKAWVLIVIGLAISIPIMVYGSTLVIHIMHRWPIVIVIGGALLGFLAGEMMVTDPVIKGWMEPRVADWFGKTFASEAERIDWVKGRLTTIKLASGVLGAALTVVVGIWLKRRAAAREPVVVDLAAPVKKD